MERSLKFQIIGIGDDDCDWAVNETKDLWFASEAVIKSYYR